MGTPQGCVLSPLQYSLYTHDYVVAKATHTIVKFADETAVVGLISFGDGMAYREELIALTQWCQDTRLSLNVSTTKDVIVYYRRRGDTHSPKNIKSTVDNLKYLDINIHEDLTRAGLITTKIKPNSASAVSGALRNFA